jgi:ribosomal protein S18 acetylase RimI-like enzyme
MVSNVREVRRRDLHEFLSLALAHAGDFERRLGLLARSERQLGSLKRPGIWILLRLLRALGLSPVRLLVADERGTPVGTTLTLLLGPWAYVAAVGVREDHRKQGIAQALVRRAEEIGRRARKTRLVLEADSENEPARSLYTKLGWSTGPTVRWWELPSTPPGAREIRVRAADRKERERAHAAAARRLGVEFPRGFVHPCELICRGPGGAHGTMATGPAGSPSLVLRYWAGRRGESGFLLPVSTAEPSEVDAGAVLEAGRGLLLRSGSQGIFVPVVGDDPRLEAVLRAMGGSLKARSEFRWKPVAPA